MKSRLILPLLVLALGISNPSEAAIKKQFSLCGLAMLTAGIAAGLGVTKHFQERAKLEERVQETHTVVAVLQWQVNSLLHDGVDFDLEGDGYQNWDQNEVGAPDTWGFLTHPPLKEGVPIDSFGNKIKLMKADYLWPSNPEFPTEGYIVISPGPDGKFKTDDDIGAGLNLELARKNELGIRIELEKGDNVDEVMIVNIDWIKFDSN